MIIIFLYLIILNFCSFQVWKQYDAFQIILQQLNAYNANVGITSIFNLLTSFSIYLIIIIYLIKRTYELFHLYEYIFTRKIYVKRGFLKEAIKHNLKLSFTLCLIKWIVDEAYLVLYGQNHIWSNLKLFLSYFITLFFYALLILLCCYLRIKNNITMLIMTVGMLIGLWCNQYKINFLSLFVPVTANQAQDYLSYIGMKIVLIIIVTLFIIRLSLNYEYIGIKNERER